MSYLQYLNDPTPENVRAVHEQSGQTQPVIAQIAGIGLHTYKGWLTDQKNKHYRKPQNPTWNYLLYELESRRLGFDNLQKFFENHKNNA